MNITLFGYPKTGKTTLFNLLTGAKIDVKSYDTGKKELNRRTFPVPDSRLEKIWALYTEKNKIPTTVDFIDLAGISYGDVKSSAYLNYLRKADGLTHVVRGFLDAQIPHPKEKISPEDDIRSMEEELILADLVSIEARLEKLEKELQKSKVPEGEKEKVLLERIYPHLEEGKAIREIELSPSEEKLSRSFSFLSQKTLLHMINVDEKDIPLIDNPEKIYSPEKKGVKVLAFCGNIEGEILELEEKDKADFLAEYGLRELSAPKFLKASYDLLEAITFFTIGKDEVKAWTIKASTTALKAAGSIHSDIEKGFIRAEVISWEELLKHGSFQTAKEKAAVRLEGKDYLVQNGDVIYFRFSP
jgi:GTP-binding protein YchF